MVADAVQSAITEPHRKNMIPAGQPRAEVSVATPQRMAIIMELGNKRQRGFGMGDTFLDSLDASHVHPIDPRKVDHPKPDQERLEAEKRDVGGDAAQMIEAGQVGWRLDADSHPYITRPEEPLESCPLCTGRRHLANQQAPTRLLQLARRRCSRSIP